MWTSACIVAITLAVSSQSGRVHAPLQDIGIKPSGHLLNGSFRMDWDDKIDGKIEPTDLKLADFILNIAGDEVAGKFVGPIAGEGREAIIVGRLDGETLLTFRQREKGYTCSYQVTLGKGAMVGVWHDSKGHSGDFRMLKYQ